MFGKRCKFVLLLAGVAVMVALSSPMRAQGDPSPASAQKVLNLVAAPIPPDSDLSKLPSHYAAWTEAQRKTGLHQIEGRCAVLWTMMNSGGKLHLLPLAQEPADTTKLISDLCVAGKMPHDWPPRQAMITDISRILQHSRELGEPLSMPATLLP